MVSRNFNLAGKVAIVTGASRGLGLGFAKELGSRGAQVVATYTSANSLELVNRLIEHIANLDGPGTCIGVRADLREEASAGKIIQATTAAFGNKIHIIVNNAGYEVVKPLTELTTTDFNAVYSLNVLAPLLLLQAARPHLSEARIINIGSVGARAGFANLSMYCSSKAAIEGMTRCWAAELGGEGHTVNAVNPGPVQSDMLDNIPKDIIDMQKKNTPVGNRLGTAGEGGEKLQAEGYTQKEMVMRIGVRRHFELTSTVFTQIIIDMATHVAGTIRTEKTEQSRIDIE
ncbi:hypothetical protein S7711_02819 [Stachybotrys chartarum IBT 7711]|uniref:Ketoreductase domain-containing protein n=1 Tax=Stachybotrys chartarum (strain CBS 109288 / IBT 7711) TaxID=1280523 RepID=A0A084AH36_STACB|nr:hypothetical protein S7711_02819 [Stachybotrys chartarum IBT 7711]